MRKGGREREEGKREMREEERGKGGSGGKQEKMEDETRGRGGGGRKAYVHSQKSKTEEEVEEKEAYIHVSAYKAGSFSFIVYIGLPSGSTMCSSGRETPEIR